LVPVVISGSSHAAPICAPFFLEACNKQILHGSKSRNIAAVLATGLKEPIIALVFARVGSRLTSKFIPKHRRTARHSEEEGMAHTNRGRVILGGLLAGLVINVVEYITNGVVLKQAWGQAMQALGKPAEFSASAIVMFNVWGFLLGIAAVWLYAAIRPRYGLGASTAIRAGFAAWGLAVFLPNLGNYPLGLFPGRLLVITTVVALVELLVATLVGAWLYKEAAEVSAIHREMA
jgi:uncharacterized membrane protein